MDRVEIVELEFPDGEVGYAEVAVPAGGDVAFWSRRFTVAELGPEIRRVTRWLVEEVGQALPDKPQRIGLEFGLRISGQAGKLVGALAQVGAEATVVIKVEWSPGENGTRR